MRDQVMKKLILGNSGNNYNYNVFSDLESKDDEEENLFEDQIIEEIGVTPKDHTQTQDDESNEKFASFI